MDEDFMLTDEMIRDLRDDASYPGELYAKCQAALGEYPWADRDKARSDLMASCRSLACYIADHGIDDELTRENKRMARLILEWPAK